MTERLARTTRPGRFDDPTAGTDSLFRLALVPGWIVVAVTTVVFLFGVSLPLTYQLVPLAVSALLFGLPHGAIDHLAPARTRREAVTRRWLAAVGLLYLVVGAAYAAAWFLVPVAAFAFFILLTWAHWGQGDVYPLVALTEETHLTDRTQRLLTALTRGGLPMLVPLVAFPEQYELVAATLVGLFDSTAATTLSGTLTTDVRLAVAVGFGALVAVTLARGWTHSTADNRRPWLLDAGETSLLVVFFLTVPPIFAVGLYFCFWHSLRHIGRLLAVDDDAVAALESRRYAAALAEFGRDAAPLTAASLGILALFYLLVPGSATEPLSLVGTYLVLVAVLTLPHVVVVSWMDREQRIWSPSGG